MTHLFTRRGALAGLAGSAAFPLGLRAQGAVFDAEVAIVGAGAAGVAAARELQKLGRTFVIVEARDRIGGRTFTDTSLGAPFDAGALYIHWAERNPWREIAESLRVETVDSSALTGPSQFFDNGEGTQFGGRRANFQEISRLFDPDVAPVPDVSFVERVGSLGADNRGGATAIARMALGDEPENISALDYARLWSGDDLVVPSGYGALVERHAQGLDIRTSTPVTAIDYSGAGVVLETPKGNLRVRAAVVTIPVGVLKSGAVRFTPELPAETRDGLDGLAMGALSKIGLKFNGQRFGIAPGTDLWQRLGPRASFDFECWPFGRDIVIAYFGGDHARDVVGRGEREALNIVLDEFVKLVGADARKSFERGVVHGWSVEPYSLGCYSHALPGHADSRAKLARPVAERLFFAGEATPIEEDFGGAMTAGGASLAGVAAARAAAKLFG